MVSCLVIKGDIQKYISLEARERLPLRISREGFAKQNPELSSGTDRAEGAFECPDRDTRNMPVRRVDILKVCDRHISGVDALRGHTRSHPEHDG